MHTYHIVWCGTYFNGNILIGNLGGKTLLRSKDTVPYLDSLSIVYWFHFSGRLKWPDGKKYTGRFKHGMQFG